MEEKEESKTQSCTKTSKDSETVGRSVIHFGICLLLFKTPKPKQTKECHPPHLLSNCNPTPYEGTLEFYQESESNNNAWVHMVAIIHFETQTLSITSTHTKHAYRLVLSKEAYISSVCENEFVLCTFERAKPSSSKIHNYTFRCENERSKWHKLLYKAFSFAPIPFKKKRGTFSFPLHFLFLYI